MTDNLAAALAQVQADLPKIAKGETAEVAMKAGGKYSYRYADLADVSQVILPLLGKAGLSWITRPTTVDGGRFVLAYELLHTSGESRGGEYPLPDRGTPQEIGSAITYARRYALCAVTGVAPASDDDDGAAATRSAREQRSPEQWSDERPVPVRFEPRSDPELARQNILANARRAIGEADEPGLTAVDERITHYVQREQITTADAVELRRLLVARLDAIHPAGEQSAIEPVEDRTAEQPEQPAMDADWPEPARPGNPT